MSDTTPLPLPPQYKHQIDKRSNTQIQLSNKIVQKLSEMNIKRIRDNNSKNILYQLQYQYYFICLTGLPYFEKQFENLVLPGERVVYSLRGQVGEFSEEEYIKIYKQSNLQRQADTINKIIQKISKTTRIIFVFHSFGGYILSTYLHKYKPARSRVCGMIDLGSIPITFYPAIARFVQMVVNVSDEDLLANIDGIYEGYREMRDPVRNMKLKNKYALGIWLKVIKDRRMEEVFQWARNYPKILKLICFGKKDLFFGSSLLNQKVIYYSYYNKLDSVYQQNLKTIYEKVYHTKVSNVQQRFIFGFEQGKHSIHMQKKLTADINLAIQQYLVIIDLMNQTQQSKL